MLSSAEYGNVKVDSFRQNSLNWALPVLTLGCSAKQCGFVGVIQEPGQVVYQSGFLFAVIKVPERTIQGKEDLLRSTDSQCQSMAVWFLQLGQNIMKIGTRGMRDPFTLWQMRTRETDKKESGTCYPQGPLMSPVTDLHHQALLPRVEEAPRKSTVSCGPRL